MTTPSEYNPAEYDHSEYEYEPSADARRPCGSPKKKTVEWTLMFYFASDNPSAPEIVSQLQALKQAGCHEAVNVIAHFDPQVEGPPTHIFEINLANRARGCCREPPSDRCGDDPFYRNLMEDKLWRDQRDRGGNLIRREAAEVLGDGYDPPEPPSGRTLIGGGQAEYRARPRRGGRREAGGRRSVETSPKESLAQLLALCAEHYPARHYALFVVGHGVVVANDMFLLDENAEERTLTLTDLREVLDDFTRLVRKQKAEFELISFHSCSVSALEVAYELHGTANYMLASQGPTFVGSWPYRRIVATVIRYKPTNPCGVRDMLKRIFSLCLENSADFLMAGYSFDLCLCDLKVARVQLREPIRRLSFALTSGLGHPLLRDLILLAHWRAQSFWQENYTDLFDFCFCLHRLIGEYRETYGDRRLPPQLVTNILKACERVQCALAFEKEEVETLCGKKTGDPEPYSTPNVQSSPPSSPPPAPGDADMMKFIVLAASVGPEYQYAHGMSVYFPWAEPSPESGIMEEYRDYKFEETLWRHFLESYFNQTRRQTRREEAAAGRGGHEPDDYLDRDPCVSPPGPSLSAADVPEFSDELFEDMLTLCYNEQGELNYSKANPRDPLGDEGGDCGCPSIKNYPRETRGPRHRATAAPARADIASKEFIPRIESLR